jgi:hypothetical protein
MGNLSKYTIPPSELDVDRILESWGWLIGKRSLTPIAVSKFGDWFLEDSSGQIHYLNILGGELVKVAASRGEFERLSEQQANCDEWFMGELVELLVERGVTLRKGQTYGYKLLPILGGKIDADNIEPTDPVVHQSILAQTLEQTRDLPSGTRITGFTIDGEDPNPRKRWWQFWK